MKLYHFTSRDRADAIAVEGLLPNGTDMSGGKRVVWLTERTGLSMTAEEHAVINRRGHFFKRWFNIGAQPMVRLEVDIDKHDPKLFRYRPWLRKQPRSPNMPNPDADYMKYTPATHWIYFGKIEPSQISRPQKHWPAYGIPAGVYFRMFEDDSEQEALAA